MANFKVRETGKSVKPYKREVIRWQDVVSQDAEETKEDIMEELGELDEA